MPLPDDEELDSATLVTDPAMLQADDSDDGQATLIVDHEERTLIADPALARMARMEAVRQAALPREAQAPSPHDRRPAAGAGDMSPDERMLPFATNMRAPVAAPRPAAGYMPPRAASQPAPAPVAPRAIVHHGYDAYAPAPTHDAPPQTARLPSFPDGHLNSPARGPAPSSPAYGGAAASPPGAALALPPPGYSAPAAVPVAPARAPMPSAPVVAPAPVLASAPAVLASAPAVVAPAPVVASAPLVAPVAPMPTSLAPAPQGTPPIVIRWLLVCGLLTVIGLMALIYFEV
jgi:hypothetical protein